jgi:hypothetical protein
MLAPDYISPFTAYRTWHWEIPTGITSLNSVSWTPREAHVAVCRNNRPHIAPDLGCTCGIYAAKHWKHLIDIGYGGYGIHGEVALWGIIEECRLGYRAQYAYPKFFCVPPMMLTMDMKIAEAGMEALIAYNVDIFVLASSKPQPNVEKVPLWVKDFGYSAQGIDFVGKYIQRLYLFKGDRADENPEVGDRLCIKGVGIAVVKSVAQNEVTITLFNQTIHRIPRERITWNFQNNRWESDTTGSSVALSRAAARGF